jgi:hypothetical protein
LVDEQVFVDKSAKFHGLLLSHCTDGWRTAESTGVRSLALNQMAGLDYPWRTSRGMGYCDFELTLTSWKNPNRLSATTSFFLWIKIEY